MIGSNKARNDYQSRMIVDMLEHGEHEIPTITVANEVTKYDFEKWIQAIVSSIEVGRGKSNMPALPHFHLGNWAQYMKDNPEFVPEGQWEGLLLPIIMTELEWVHFPDEASNASDERVKMVAERATTSALKRVLTLIAPDFSDSTRPPLTDMRIYRLSLGGACSRCGFAYIVAELAYRGCIDRNIILDITRPRSQAGPVMINMV